MSKCIFMRGLPGSGKSTYAGKLGIPVFNRDTVRLEDPNKKEIEIEKMEKEFLRNNIDKDICIDNTHMGKSLGGKIQFAESLGYVVEIVDMFDICHEFRNNMYSYLSFCLNNNKNRDLKVPESVIYEMRMKEFPTFSNYANVIICDIDGTIADLSHRLHHIQGEIKDHESFYNEVGLDTPIQPVIDVINALSEQYTIILVSGRRNQTYRETQEWLEKHNVNYDYILMRGGRDRRQDTEVKQDIYNNCLKQCNILGVFDDRPSVCKMRQEQGLFVFNCQQGYKEF